LTLAFNIKVKRGLDPLSFVITLFCLVRPQYTDKILMKFLSQQHWGQALTLQIMIIATIGVNFPEYPLHLFIFLPNYKNIVWLSLCGGVSKMTQ